MGAKKILMNVDQVGATVLVSIKKIWTEVDLVGATVLAGANNSGERKKDLEH
ncbi:hypothetical protein [uncultured Nostoc sp.]|uniref:hypothetical protein n=1 Tax=uncultured Nostoc sp. TaxID=340711 RepID=UPI0035CBD4C3